MYHVFILSGTSQDSKRSFVSPYSAEEYFHDLCRKRPPGDATVILTNNRRVRKKYHIGKEWNGERMEYDDSAVC